MREPDRVVRSILAYLEGRIDVDRAARVAARHRAALTYAEIERPPLTIYLPYEGRDFAPYPVAEAVTDPAKMMVNELLRGFTSIYHAVDLADDAPWCLRPNFGTVLIASTFGAEVVVVEDNPPWVRPLGHPERVREAALETPPLHGWWFRVLDQYAYFGEAVADFPACAAALQFTLPDLQGPFSVAELLWGGDIYLALYDEPATVAALLDSVTTQIIRAWRELAPLTRETLGAGFCYQHAAGVAGNLLIRNDSMINLSPAMYRSVVWPHDARLCEAAGTAGVHFCGNGTHQVSNLLSLPDLRSIDLGQPEMMDLDALYARSAAHRVALVRLAAPLDELRATLMGRRFPGGVSLAAKAGSVAEGHALLAQYEST